MAALTAHDKRTSVRGLGEIALRVNNLGVMQKFYEEVIGLLPMKRFPNATFFKIADGYGGGVTPEEEGGNRTGLNPFRIEGLLQSQPQCDQPSL